MTEVGSIHCTPRIEILCCSWNCSVLLKVLNNEKAITKFKHESFTSLST